MIRPNVDDAGGDGGNDVVVVANEGESPAKGFVGVVVVVVVVPGFQ